MKAKYPLRIFFSQGIVVFLIVVLFGCATYYQKNIEFHDKFYHGQLEESLLILDKNKKAATNNHRLLFFLNKGLVLNLLGKYQESNEFFEKAYIYIEDVHANVAQVALSLISNPNSKPYQPEDFESVLLLYYKALNYIKLNQWDEALVECRRIDIKLNGLNDKYGSHKNRYKRDAFSQNLMGMIYEASGDNNNGFIAYRNAYEVYADDYKKFFGIDVPLQLKKDLIRSAKKAGFREEKEFYEREFDMKYEESPQNSGEVIFLWHNGLSPVKDEWSINFTILQGSGGMVTFANEEYGLNFPFYVGDGDGQGSSFGDLHLIRAAFPKYRERKPVYYSAEIFANQQNYKIENGENINDIAFKTLDDRMVREFANTLLRVALKQLAEAQVRKKSEGLGALASIVNAVTEKADTRNWQTLPYSINYTRIFLPEGENEISFKALSGNGGSDLSETFKFNIKKGKTIFHSYHTLNSME